MDSILPTTARPDERLQWPFWAGAALPCLLGMVFHLVGPSAQSAMPRPPRPALTFDQYQVNLGEVPPQALHAATFVFTNTSDRPVKVTRLEPSCGCLSPRLERMDYAPGESGHFSLRVQASNEDPGPKEYYCTIYYEDPDPREVKVAFKIVLPEETIAVQPTALIVYQFGDEPVEKELLVTNYHSSRLNVQDVICTSEYASVELGAQGHDPDGNPRRVVNVTINAAPPGKHQGVIRIYTDDERFPEVRVPLFIQSARTSAGPASSPLP